MLIRTKYMGGQVAHQRPIWEDFCGNIRDRITNPEKDDKVKQVSIGGIMAYMTIAAFSDWQNYVRSKIMPQFKTPAQWEAYNSGKLPDSPKLEDWNKKTPNKDDVKLMKFHEGLRAWVDYYKPLAKMPSFPVDLSQRSGSEYTDFIGTILNYPTVEDRHPKAEEYRNTVFINHYGTKVKTTKKGLESWEQSVYNWFMKNNGQRAVELISIVDWVNSLSGEPKAKTVFI